MIFTKVLMKDLRRMLIHIRKLFNCSVSFKILFSNVSHNLLNRNFRHSFDQVTFRMALLKKITITVTEVVLIQVSFYTVGSKQK